MIRPLRERDFEAVTAIVNDGWRATYAGYVAPALLEDTGCRERAAALEQDFRSHRLEEYVWEEEGAALLRPCRALPAAPSYLCGSHAFGRRSMEKLENPETVYPTTVNYVVTHDKTLDRKGFLPVRGDVAELVRGFPGEKNIWIIGGDPAEQQKAPLCPEWNRRRGLRSSSLCFLIVFAGGLGQL